MLGLFPTQHRQKTWHVRTAVLARRDRLKQRHFKTCAYREATQIAFAMGVAGVRSERQALACMRLDREGEQAVGPERPAYRCEHGVERGEIDEHVRRDDEVRTAFRRRLQKWEQSGFVECSIGPRSSRFRQHARRRASRIISGARYFMLSTKCRSKPGA